MLLLTFCCTLIFVVSLFVYVVTKEKEQIPHHNKGDSKMDKASPELIKRLLSDDKVKVVNDWFADFCERFSGNNDEEVDHIVNWDELSDQNDTETFYSSDNDTIDEIDNVEPEEALPLVKCMDRNALNSIKEIYNQNITEKNQFWKTNGYLSSFRAISVNYTEVNGMDSVSLPKSISMDNNFFQHLRKLDFHNSIAQSFQHQPELFNLQSDDDSDTSVDTERYILSSRKHQRQRVNVITTKMTIKQYCYLNEMNKKRLPFDGNRQEAITGASKSSPVPQVKPSGSTKQSASKLRANVSNKITKRKGTNRNNGPIDRNRQSAITYASKSSPIPNKVKPNTSITHSVSKLSTNLGNHFNSDHSDSDLDSARSNISYLTGNDNSSICKSECTTSNNYISNDLSFKMPISELVKDQIIDISDSETENERDSSTELPSLENSDDENISQAQCTLIWDI